MEFRVEQCGTFFHPPPPTQVPTYTIEMARRLLPLLDRVLVEKVVPAVKTAGGVLLPESAAPRVSGGKQAHAAPDPACELAQPAEFHRL